MSTLLSNVEQNIRKRIRQNQCAIRCELPFTSQAGFAFSSTVGTDRSGGKAIIGGSGSSATQDLITAITVEAVNGIFENLTSTQFTTENISASNVLIQQATIAQINGDVNFNGAVAQNVNIDSGTLDGVIIGGDNPAYGTFEELQVNSSFNILGASGQICVNYDASEEVFYICGDLVVQGNSTTLESEIVVIQDPTIRLGNTAPLGDDGKDRGIEFGYHTGSNFEMGFMGWDNSENIYTLLLGATNNNTEIYSGTLANLKMDLLYANQIQGISGNFVIGTTGNIIINPTNDIQIPENTTLLFGTSSYIYNNASDFNISTPNDLILDVSGSVNIPSNIPIEFGTTQFNIYSNTSDLLISSPNDLILNVSGSVNIPSNIPIEFGTTKFNIYSNTLDLIISSPNDLLLNISGSVNIPSNIPLEFGLSGNNIKNNNNDVIISANDDIVFNTDCIILGITKDIMLCNLNGNLEIINSGLTGNILIETFDNLILDVSGSITIPTNTTLEFASAEQNIYSNNEDLILSSTGSVIMNSDCLYIGISKNISLCNVNDTLTFGATSIIFNSNNIDIPIVKEFCRISYKECDIDGDYNVCEVISKRDLIGGFPVWYWLTDVQESGTIIYAYDLNQHVRDITTKGLKLTGVYFWFEISSDNVNSINSTITKSIMNPLSPGLPTLSAVTVNNSILNTNTNIGTYYTKVDVSSTNYYNSHENLTIELAINKKTNSVIKFYGMQLEFDKKYF